MLRVNKQIKPLLLIKTLTTIGITAGFLTFITSFFANGVTKGYLASIGISVMVSMMLVFGFGMFLSLIEEVSEYQEKYN